MKQDGEVKPDARSDTTLLLHREDLVVERHIVSGDVVRVETVTQLREQRVEVALMHERIDIVHVPIGRFVDAVPEIRQEGHVTIMPVIEEVLVVERRLRLVEEVHISRVDQIEQHVEAVVLRSQEARVTRHPATTETASSQGTE